MNKKLMILKNSRVSIFLIALLGFVIYFPSIISSSPFDPDAQKIIPLLENCKNVGDYFARLMTLKTLDFQPVRDVTLYVDITVNKLWGLNSLVFFNLVFWTFSICVVGRILKKVFPKIGELEIYLIMITFFFYPLFVWTVAWGMARKHLLSFLFILLATDKLLEINQNNDWKNVGLINIYYALSIFSQPISILWPIWGLVFLYLENHNLKFSLYVLKTTLVICLIGIIVNYLYYAYSPVMLSIYGSKTSSVWDFSDKILALGHYIFQLFYPYLMSFSYELGHWSTITGILILGFFAYLVLGFKVDRRKAILWALYALLPLTIVTVKATTLFDTYLLLPSLGVLILILLIKERLPDFKHKNKIYVLLLLVGGWRSYNESNLWADEIKLTGTSFERRPSCKTAYDFLKLSYENGRPPHSNQAKHFFFEYNCASNRAQNFDLLNFKSNMLFYEEDFSADQRIDKLKSFARLALYPNIVLSALYIKLNKEREATQALSNMIDRWGNLKHQNAYLPLVDEYLKPFCQKNDNQKCLDFINPFVFKEMGIRYK
jgi:hypothetical protein